VPARHGSHWQAPCPQPLNRASERAVLRPPTASLISVSCSGSRRRRDQRVGHRGTSAACPPRTKRAERVGSPREGRHRTASLVPLARRRSDVKSGKRMVRGSSGVEPLFLMPSSAYPDGAGATRRPSELDPGIVGYAAGAPCALVGGQSATHGFGPTPPCRVRQSGRCSGKASVAKSTGIATVSITPVFTPSAASHEASTESWS